MSKWSDTGRGCLFFALAAIATLFLLFLLLIFLGGLIAASK